MFQGEGRYYNPYKYDSNLISFYIPLLSLYLFTYRCSLGSYAFVSKSNVDNGYHISSDKNKSLERFCMCVCVFLLNVLRNVNLLELRKLFFFFVFYIIQKIKVYFAIVLELHYIFVAKILLENN